MTDTNTDYLEKEIVVTGSFGQVQEEEPIVSLVILWTILVMADSFRWIVISKKDRLRLVGG